MLSIVPLHLIPLARFNSSRDLENVDILDNIRRVCQQLRALCEAENGAGISAVQAGLPMHLFLIKSGTEYRYFLDCVYRPLTNETFVHTEGCLSIKENGNYIFYDIRRLREIEIIGYELQNGVDLVPLNGYAVRDYMATVFQHEIDHGFGFTIDMTGVRNA